MRSKLTCIEDTVLKNEKVQNFISFIISLHSLNLETLSSKNHLE